MIDDSDRAFGILRTVVEWAKAKEAIRGVALVDSYARNQGRPDSDIDLVLMTEHPNDFETAFEADRKTRAAYERKRYEEKHQQPN